MNRKRNLLIAIVVAIVLAIIGLGAASASATPVRTGGTAGLAKSVGCLPEYTIVIYKGRGVQDISCKDGAYRTIEVTSFASGHDQGVAIYQGENDARPTWIVRCDLYNVQPRAHRLQTKSWATGFAASRSKCKAVHLNKAIAPRLAGLPG